MIHLRESIISKKTGMYSGQDIGLTTRTSWEEFQKIVGKWAEDTGTALTSELVDANKLYWFAKDAMRKKKSLYMTGHDGDWYHIVVANKRGIIADTIFDLYGMPNEIVFYEYKGSPKLKFMDRCNGMYLDIGIEQINTLLKE